MASTEMSYGRAVRDELRVPTRELRHALPQVYAGYKELHDAALAPGALDAKTKELIVLAIAVSKECDGCIAAHAHAAVQHGASPAEAAEAAGAEDGPAGLDRMPRRGVRVLRRRPGPAGAGQSQDRGGQAGPV